MRELICADTEIQRATDVPVEHMFRCSHDVVDERKQTGRFSGPMFFYAVICFLPSAVVLSLVVD